MAAYLNSGAGLDFTEEIITTDANTVVSVVAADVDGDGALDALARLRRGTRLFRPFEMNFI